MVNYRFFFLLLLTSRWFIEMNRTTPHGVGHNCVRNWHAEEKSQVGRSGV